MLGDFAAGVFSTSDFLFNGQHTLGKLAPFSFKRCSVEQEQRLHQGRLLNA